MKMYLAKRVVKDRALSSSNKLLSSLESIPKFRYRKELGMRQANAVANRRSAIDNAYNSTVIKRAPSNFWVGSSTKADSRNGSISVEITQRGALPSFLENDIDTNIYLSVKALSERDGTYEVKDVCLVREGKSVVAPTIEFDYIKDNMKLVFTLYFRTGVIFKRKDMIIKWSTMVIKTNDKVVENGWKLIKKLC